MQRKARTLRSEYAAQVAIIDSASRSKYPARLFDQSRTRDDDPLAMFSIKQGDPEDPQTWGLMPL